MGLANSRTISRKAPMKGVKAIGIAPYSVSALVVNTATGVIALPVTMTTPAAIVRVEVKATGNNVVETGTFDEATRTNEFVGVNTFFIPGTDDLLRKEIQTDAGFLKTVFIEDYNGNIYVLGSQNGCDIMTLAFSTDTQGFQLTINSKEAELMYKLAAAGVTAYRSAVVATV